MIPVTIIGMGMSFRDLTQAHWDHIHKAHVLVGGVRHLAHFKDLGCETRAVDKDLKALTAYIQEQMQGRRVVVLASGDPFYYGIGGYLAKVLGPENIRVLPNVSAVAAAFARLKMPWQAVPVISLHGRSGLDMLIEKMNTHAVLAVYTDPENSPARLAAQLRECVPERWRMCVLERLGDEEEQIQWFSLDQAAETGFNEPNLVVLVKAPTDAPSTPKAMTLGMPEAWFSHEAGLITKTEVRAVTLAKLALEPHHVLWDLGAGSGSVGIEASMFLPRGKIFAVEKNPERLDRIRANAESFGVKNLKTVQAVLPGGMDRLPAPDRIFIGGGGADLAAIMQAALERLKPDGRMVVNTVGLEQLHQAMAVFDQNRMNAQVTHLQVSRSKPLGTGRFMVPLNPVWIISAGK